MTKYFIDDRNKSEEETDQSDKLSECINRRHKPATSGTMEFSMSFLFLFPFKFFGGNYSKNLKSHCFTSLFVYFAFYFLTILFTNDLAKQIKNF